MKEQNLEQIKEARDAFLQEFRNRTSGLEQVLVPENLENYFPLLEKAITYSNQHLNDELVEDLTGRKVFTIEKSIAESLLNRHGDLNDNSVYSSDFESCYRVLDAVTKDLERKNEYKIEELNEAKNAFLQAFRNRSSDFEQVLIPENLTKYFSLLEEAIKYSNNHLNERKVEELTGRVAFDTEKSIAESVLKRDNVYSTDFESCYRVLDAVKKNLENQKEINIR